MAEDLTGLTLPSKTLVKRYKLIYAADPLPTPIPAPTPAPSRPSTGSTGGFSGGSTQKNNPFGVSTATQPVTPSKTIKLSAGQTVTIGGVTYTAGSHGAYVYIWSSGQTSFVQIP